MPREGPTAGIAEAQPAMQLTDGQILEITHAANVGEIDQARLALSRTTDSRVKSLAQMMVQDHSQADKKGMVVAKKANIEREPSAVSQSLKSDVDSATGTLKPEPKADFDKNYVDTQIREHQSVLDAIDQKLMVNASNPDLKGISPRFERPSPPTCSTHKTCCLSCRSDPRMAEACGARPGPSLLQALRNGRRSDMRERPDPVAEGVTGNSGCDDQREQDEAGP